MIKMPAREGNIKFKWGYTVDCRAKKVLLKQRND